MINESENAEPVQKIDENEKYQAPAIESVMNPEDLSREVQYAGVADGITGIR